MTKLEDKVNEILGIDPPEEPKKEGSMIRTGIVVGGLVVAGTLSYVVYRGLSTN